LHVIRELKAVLKAVGVPPKTSRWGPLISASL